MTHSRFEHQFTMSAPAGSGEVRVLLRRLRQQLTEFGVSEPTCASAELVLAEALNNITEHAYGGEPGGAVQVMSQIGSGMIRFTLSDQGGVLPGSRLPRGKNPDTEVPLQELPEGGFGWMLIRKLTSSVTYDRDEEGNRLIMTLPNT